MRPEQLEPRAMLAIATASGGPISNYLIVASDQASDVYVQRHAGDFLLISDNSSFLANTNFSEQTPPDILYVTNGAAGAGPGPMFAGNNTTGNYQADPLLSGTTGFTLSSANITRPTYDLDTTGRRIPITTPAPSANPLPSEAFQISNSIRGRVSYDGATWDFEVDPQGPMVFRLRAGGNPTPAASPISGGVSTGSATARGRVTIDWGSPTTGATIAVATVPHPAAPGIPAPPVISTITYSVGTAIQVDSGIVPSTTSAQYRFTIPPNVYAGATLRGIIPGSFRGVLTIDGAQVSVADDFQTSPIGGAGVATLYFNGSASYAVNPFVTVSGNYVVAGDVVTVSLSFSSAPIGPPVLGAVRYLAYVEDPNPNTFTLFAGHDLTSQLATDLLTSNSTVSIDSPITVPTPLRNSQSNREDVVLRATNIEINAQVAATDTIRVGPSLVGTAIAETFRVNAAVAAPRSFIFDVGDDPRTTTLERNPTQNPEFIGPNKGLISLSPSGSLSGAISPLIAGVTVPTDLVLVRAVQSDIVSEGVIYGKNQTYLINSGKGASEFAPYTFSTRSQATGADTGLIRGGTVSVTLGNDVPTPLDQSIAYNTMDLNTQLDSLRVKAGTQQSVGTPPNPSVSGPFPYELSVREVDDISIDAVAASGLPISIQSGGNMRFTSALATASDVTLRALATGDALSRLTVSAPLSTTKGKVRLVGDNVAIGNSIVVSGAEEDAYRDDIWITANRGDVVLNGLVSAVNRVKIEQYQNLQTVETRYSNDDSLAIPDLQTVTQAIDVPDDFVFDSIDIGVDITHGFVGDLIGTLIAPNGRRITLFNRNGGAGDNFTGTIFDSEAVDGAGNPVLIANGQAPFTGRYRPVQSLAPLYGSSALGTWRLEVQDTNARDAGTLNNFTLRFLTTQSVGKVYGPARVVADQLICDVRGSVGDPSKVPTDTSFFLRTDVDTITGAIGGNAAFDELNDVDIPGLRAGGFVSLRANGVDPTAGANAGKPALKAKLIDITGLDVASPNGSVDVLFDTSKTIQMGNAQGLRTGQFLNSVAAGNVSIRSTAGSIVALDAPVAGGNARSVRVATSTALTVANNGQTLSSVTYAAGNPGVTASTLRGRGDLNAWLGVQVQPLRVGDRVLVKDQTGVAQGQNGVYSVSFMSTTSWASGTVWTLTRATDSDTAAELPSNSFVTVGETQAGNVNQVGTWQVSANYLPLNGVTKVGSSYANASTSAVVGSTADLQVGMLIYGPGIAANTTIQSIASATAVTLSRATTAASPGGGASLKFVSAVTRTGTTNGGLDDVLITGLATTADLKVGMLVVGVGIPDDTLITRVLNGSTVVISNPATSAATGAISFVKSFVRRNGATTNASVQVSGLSSTSDLLEGMVVIGPGIVADTTIASIVNGSTITLSRATTATQAAASLKFLAATPSNFGYAPITVAAKSVKTDIGSNTTSGTVTFVVSTTGGTNNSAGSLGKMIALRQQNSAWMAGDPATGKPQPMNFQFSAAVATNLTPIRLTQELPVITKAFTIDGSPTYPATNVAGLATPPLIDGSRITQSRTGRNLVAGDLVNGIVVSGAGASGTVIRNLSIGGFSRSVTSGATTAQSAAIDVRDAAGVLVSNVTLGVSEFGVRLGNGVGVRFSGAVVGPTAASGVPTSTTIAATGLIPVALNQYANSFAVRIVEDAANGNPAVVGQVRRIVSHTAGAAPVFTVDPWGVLPTSSAKFVIERIEAFTGPATVSGVPTTTTISGLGIGSLASNQYRNFQLRIVEDSTNPAAVGQSRSIVSHTAGTTPVFTVAAFAVTPSRNAKFVIETSPVTSGTVLNSNIYGSVESGVVVENGASRVSVVGTTIGKLGIENGVAATFSSGVNQFGVDSVSPIQALPSLTATKLSNTQFRVPLGWPDNAALRLTPGLPIFGQSVVPTSGNYRPTIAAVSTTTGFTTITVANGTVSGAVLSTSPVTFVTTDPATIPVMLVTGVNSSTFTLPAALKASAGLLYPGLPLMGSNIAATASNVPARVASVSFNPGSNETTVTITGGTVTGNGSVTFGHVAATVLNGKVLALPASVNLDNLFLGQAVSGVGIAAGAVITAIDRVNRTITFADNRLMTRDGFNLISFTAGGRNSVTQNRTGLVLAGGATTVTNSSILANTFNGIEISGSGATVNGQTLHHRIGTTPTPSLGSNQIHSNGGWGVFFKKGVTDVVKRGVTIRGNYLGTTSSAVVSTTLSNKKGNIGHDLGAGEIVFSGIVGPGELTPRAVDGIDPSNNQHGRYQAGGGGSSGSGGVR